MLGIQVTCIVLVSLYVQMFILSVNKHCGHYLVVIACLVKPWFVFCSDCLFDQAMVCFLTPSLLDHIILASYAFHAFLHTMITVYCCVLGDSCSYDSRASQFLELGMSELYLIVPNSYVKSKVCFRVLSRNSQRGRL